MHGAQPVKAKPEGIKTQQKDGQLDDLINTLRTGLGTLQHRRRRRRFSGDLRCSSPDAEKRAVWIWLRPR